MEIKLKGIVAEDFCQYKKACMFIIFPYCTFKCDKEYGKPVCQNSDLANMSCIVLPTEYIVNKYLSNDITHSIVFGGLEPFDSTEMIDLISAFREKTEDDIVIYTGYNKEEISDQLEQLKQFPNIIVKFGRYKPDQEGHIDSVLGIRLANKEQYAERLS